MYLEIFGITIGTFGTLMIAFAALKVHFRMFKEHSIDKEVLRDIKKEWMIGLFGMGLIGFGYICEIVGMLYFTVV